MSTNILWYKLIYLCKNCVQRFVLWPSNRFSCFSESLVSDGGQSSAIITEEEFASIVLEDALEPSASKERIDGKNFSRCGLFG